jgi:hypothetical protein
MLEIREEQVKIFQTEARRKFESQMVSHLDQLFPERCRELGEEKIREMIQYGVKHATTYRIISHRHVCRFIDLLVLLGRDFETQLSLNEFQAILNDLELHQRPDVKLERLGELVRKRGRIGGPGAGSEGEEAGRLAAASADADQRFGVDPLDSVVASYPAVEVSSPAPGG